MRRFRYGDPTKAGFFKKYGNFLYFFAAWNLLGMVVWKSMNANKRADDEDWDKKSSTERYLSIIGYGQDSSQTKRVKIHGLKVESSSEERTS